MCVGKSSNDIADYVKNLEVVKKVSQNKAFAIKSWNTGNASGFIPGVISSRCIHLAPLISFSNHYR